jgi:hypothetical protein
MASSSDIQLLVLTSSLEQNSSWDANSRSAAPEISEGSLTRSPKTRTFLFKKENGFLERPSSSENSLNGN